MTISCALATFLPYSLSHHRGHPDHNTLCQGLPHSPAARECLALTRQHVQPGGQEGGAPEAACGAGGDHAELPLTKAAGQPAPQPLCHPACGGQAAAPPAVASWVPAECRDGLCFAPRASPSHGATMVTIKSHLIGKAAWMAEADMGPANGLASSIDCFIKGAAKPRLQ